jgi:hypothetical protein
LCLSECGTSIKLTKLQIPDAKCEKNSDEDVSGLLGLESHILKKDSDQDVSSLPESKEPYAVTVGPLKDSTPLLPACYQIKIAL